METLKTRQHLLIPERNSLRLRQQNKMDFLDTGMIPCSFILFRLDSFIPFHRLLIMWSFLVGVGTGNGFALDALLAG